MMDSPLPLLSVLAPLIGAALILVTRAKRADLREFCTILASVGLFGAVYAMIPLVLEGRTLKFTLVPITNGVALELRVDAFGLVFALLASFLWIVVSVYAIGYMRGLKEHAQTRFYFCFAMAIFGATGVALSGNLLTLYMFYEILTVATFPLVAHKETPEAAKAARKYLVYLLTGAAFVLFAMAATYYLTGSLDFFAGGFVAGRGSPDFLRIIFAAFIIGFGTKAALMPLHEWLPSAMVAPTPVSALLHAVAVVKAGVFCCLRVILYVFGPKTLTDLHLWTTLAVVVSFTVIAANLFALTQDNLKRRLAFSTINNLAVIILGASLITFESVRGALLHLPFHGFMKITLFMCAGAIYVATKKELISDLNGIGRRMPVTMTAFTIGAAGLVGIPPVSGFLSKWYLCLGALRAGEIVFLFVFLTSALLDAAYFFPIIFNAFFKPGPGNPGRVREAPFPLVAPLAVTAFFSVVFFFFPDAVFYFYGLGDIVVKNLFGGR
ncbi:MAG: monovalent cation/H+ antiporter subunit D family protein [Thermodesulfobacteriota bacterium]